MKKIHAYMGMLEKLRNDEHFDTHDAILSYGKDKHMLIPGITPLWNIYIAGFVVEDEEYKESQKQPGTVEIKEMDTLRCETLREINRTAEYFTYSKIVAEKEAALLLMQRLLVYKEAGNKSYTENSSLITNLVDDLKKETYTDALALLRLTETVTLLEEQNNTFKELYRTRSKEVYMSRLPKLAIARHQTDLAFDAVANGLVSSYNNTIMVSPDSELLPVIGDLIDTINSYLNTAAKNLARHSNYTVSKSEETPPLPNPSNIPHLIISEQITSDPDGPGGKKMSFKAQDAVHFAIVLHPVAVGGVVRMVDEDGNIYDFPILSFLMSEGTDPVVTGLTVGQYKPGGFFDMPFKGVYNAPAMVIKEDITLAVFDGASLPDMTHID